ncbi:MAG: ABC transporter [Cyclobacteriaceae bacterium]|nr:MAG: ABC transporter [Cyclobacteriaceae bacterium]
MKELRYLDKYLLKYKYHLILGTIFIIITNVVAIIPAQVVRHAINLVKENIDLYSLFSGSELQDNLYEIFGQSILLAGLLIVAMAVLRGIFLFFVRQTIIVMSRLIEYDLKNEIYQHYQTLPLSFYRRNNTGDLMARISEDVSRVRMYLGPAIMYGINLVTLFIIVIGYMITVNPKLTLYSLLPLPVLSVSIYLVSSVMNKRSEEIQQSLASLSTFVQEAFSGIRVLKSFIREEDSEKQFARESKVYRDKSLKLTFVNSLFFPLIMGLIGMSVILTVFIGGDQVIDGSLTIGNIAEFIIYVNMLTWPVASLGWVTSLIQRADASQKRINEFLKVKTDIVSLQDLKKEIKGEINFQNVSFTYPDSGIQALNGISFQVAPGQSLAIIGTTGSGKSTIANIICRLYDVSSGIVTIDGEDIRNYDLAHLRQSIGYVPQDVFLFSDSINNNIGFGNGSPDEAQIIQAAKDSDLYHNINQFPNGFETVLGERGITLSGGQKQRVSIARAIIRKPKILILDDSLSAVDTKTEHNILSNLQHIMKDCTTVIISHRVSSAKLADHILVLDGGAIIEQGKETELLAQNGVYRELYDKQIQVDELA